MSAARSELERRGIDSRVVDLLPSLEEKWLVDFVNGLSVAKDHSRMQRTRDGKLARALDGVSGKSKRRQDEINASLIDGLEGSLKWLEEVTRETSSNSYAIAHVSDRLSKLKIDVAGLADFTRGRAEEMDGYIEIILSRLSQQQSGIQRLDLRVRAKENLDFVIDRWTAGYYRGLSPMARCYTALEELRWGAFGDFMRLARAGDQREWRQNLVDKLAVQLAWDVDKAIDERVIFRDYWLVGPAADDTATMLKSAIRYLGNWSHAKGSPFVYVASQTPGDMPLGIPLIGAADRVAVGLTSEVFEDVTHDG